MKVKLLVALSLVVLGAGMAARGADPATSTAPATRPAPKLLVEDPTKPSASRSGAGAVNNGWIRTHTNLAAKAKAGGIDLYMEGDSITDFWQSRFPANWNKNLAAWKAGDFGISGDRTQNVLYRIANGEMDGVTPKVIVLLIGTNNLATNATYGDNSVEDTAKGVAAVVDALKAKAPQAKILLIAIFPRGDTKGGPDIWAKITKTNALISKLDDGNTVKFLDFNDKLADKNGKLIPGVMNADNLHPSDKGYQIWFDAMQPILTQWLGAPPAAATQGK